MGLDRIAALFHGSHENYETYHFKQIINSASASVKVKSDKSNLASFGVIAHNLRASCDLIAEDV